MSSPITQRAAHYKKTTVISTALIIAVMAVSTSGCSTTQEFKPTASVIVGTHKSL